MDCQKFKGVWKPWVERVAADSSQPVCHGRGGSGAWRKLVTKQSKHRRPGVSVSQTRKTSDYRAAPSHPSQKWPPPRYQTFAPFRLIHVSCTFSARTSSLWFRWPEGELPLFLLEAGRAIKSKKAPGKILLYIVEEVWNPTKRSTDSKPLTRQLLESVGMLLFCMNNL